MKKAYYYITIGCILALIIVSSLLCKAYRTPKPQRLVEMQHVIDSLAQRIAFIENRNENDLRHARVELDTAVAQATRPLLTELGKTKAIVKYQIAVIEDLGEDYADAINNKDTVTAVLACDSLIQVIPEMVRNHEMEIEIKDSIAALQTDMFRKVRGMNTQLIDMNVDLITGAKELIRLGNEQNKALMQFDKKEKSFIHKWGKPIGAAVIAGVVGYYTGKAIK